MDGFVVWWADFRTKMPANWKTDKTGTVFHAQVMDWLTSLGLDVDRLGPAVGVCPWEGKYELHVDEALPGKPGMDRVDPLNEGNVLLVRRIIHVEKDSWPSRPEEVAA